MTGENSKKFYPDAQYEKMRKGRWWSTSGSVILQKSLRIMQLSITFGDNTFRHKPFLFLFWKRLLGLEGSGGEEVGRNGR